MDSSHQYLEYAESCKDFINWQQHLNKAFHEHAEHNMSTDKLWIIKVQEMYL